MRARGARRAPRRSGGAGSEPRRSRRSSDGLAASIAGRWLERAAGERSRLGCVRLLMPRDGCLCSLRLRLPTRRASSCRAPSCFGLLQPRLRGLDRLLAAFFAVTFLVPATTLTMPRAFGAAFAAAGARSEVHRDHPGRARRQTCRRRRRVQRADADLAPVRVEHVLAVGRRVEPRLDRRVGVDGGACCRGGSRRPSSSQ